MLEEQFIDYTVQRLRLLQKGIRTELQKEKSEIFIDGDKWNDRTLEDFVQQSYRKKIMSHRKLETSFEKQLFFAQNNFKLDERYEMSKNDNYVATLIDEMMGFDNKGTFYRDFENTVKYQASLLRETKKYTKDEIVSIVAKNMNISEAEVRRYTNIK